MSAVQEARKALLCLFLATEETIAADINKKVEAAFAEKDAAYDLLVKIHADLVEAVGPNKSLLAANTELRRYKVAALEELLRFRTALEKIADPRKRDHSEPDAYTQLGCVMQIALDALEPVKPKGFFDKMIICSDESGEFDPA